MSMDPAEPSSEQTWTAGMTKYKSQATEISHDGTVIVTIFHFLMIFTGGLSELQGACARICNTSILHCASLERCN
jgi:hypothetical protein